MEEMASIAHAQLGEAAAEINADFIEELLNRPSVKEGIYSSMCQDAKFSRPMEVEVNSMRLYLRGHTHFHTRLS